MPVVNWPPAAAPTWPPVEMNISRYECSDLRGLVWQLLQDGFTRATPTQAERNAYFPNSVRCDENHTVLGTMLVSPGGARYPFAVCTNVPHRQLLVLWGPGYCMGSRSGEE